MSWRNILSPGPLGVKPTPRGETSLAQYPHNTQNPLGVKPTPRGETSLAQYPHNTQNPRNEACKGGFADNADIALKEVPPTTPGTSHENPGLGFADSADIALKDVPPTPPRRRWLVTLPSGERFESLNSPPVTWQEILSWHPPGTAVYPLPDDTQDQLPEVA